MSTDALPPDPSRRRFFGASGACLAALGLGWSPLGRLAAGEPAHPLRPRPGHHPVRAKRLIMVYLTGGFSHVDSFDPKPRLREDHDRPWIDGKGKDRGKFLKGTPFAFERYGACGLEVSELFPHIGGMADELCLIRSMRTDHGNHFQATLAMHTGSVSVPMPSLGSWLSYGLGTRNLDLPSYVVLCESMPYAGSQTWDSSFLPAVHQGMHVTPGADPIPDLKRAALSDWQQRHELELLEALNGIHGRSRADDDQLAARVVSFRTAMGMQAAAPRVFDLAGESAATRALYGLKEGDETSFAWQCLMARRFAEAGTRVIELIHTGSNKNWDAHGDMATHAKLAAEIDRPVAALLQDLRRRGMLDETLVVFCTEFGRTPYVDRRGHKGREHHPRAFSCWLAGGGAKRGHVHGASDDYGIEVADGLVHLHDFHATILHLMGFDHERLTYRYAGRDFRLTDVHGHVVRELLG